MMSKSLCVNLIDIAHNSQVSFKIFEAYIYNLVKALILIFIIIKLIWYIKCVLENKNNMIIKFDEINFDLWDFRKGK